MAGAAHRYTAASAWLGLQVQMLLAGLEKLLPALGCEPAADPCQEEPLVHVVLPGVGGGCPRSAA